MASVDFTSWVVPDLKLTLGGVTYEVAPPDVERAKMILALTVREELRLGLSKGDLPEQLKTIIENAVSDRQLGEITLGPDVYERMVTDRVAVTTIERMAYYAMLFWARGQERADAIASALWAPKDDIDSGDDSGE